MSSKQPTGMTKTDSHIFIIVGALFGALAVAGGAFGTHSLQDALSEARLETFETGMHYLLLHSVVLLTIGLLNSISPVRQFYVAGWLIVSGITIFSGSLTLLVLLDVPVLGAVTPVGGVLLIAGWVVLAVGGIRTRREQND